MFDIRNNETTERGSRDSSNASLGDIQEVWCVVFQLDLQRNAYLGKSYLLRNMKRPREDDSITCSQTPVDRTVHIYHVFHRSSSISKYHR